MKFTWVFYESFILDWTLLINRNRTWRHWRISTSSLQVSDDPPQIQSLCYSLCWSLYGIPTFTNQAHPSPPYPHPHITYDAHFRSVIWRSAQNCGNKTGKSQQRVRPTAMRRHLFCSPPISQGVGWRLALWDLWNWRVHAVTWKRYLFWTSSS